jgi:hypothetical protein
MPVLLSIEGFSLQIMDNVFVARVYEPFLRNRDNVFPPHLDNSP